MQDILESIHTGMTYVLGITVAFTYVWLILGLFTKRAYGTLTRRIMFAFGWLLVAQWVSGIGTLIARGDLEKFWLHALTMTVAVALVGRHNLRQPSDDPKQYRAGLGAITISLVLIIAGITLLFVG